MVIGEAQQRIETLYRQEAQRRQQRDSLVRIIHSIDDLLFQLEDLNLMGTVRVPANLRDRADQILNSIPGREEHVELRLRIHIVPMMDVLFRAQEVIFRLRDPLRTADNDGDGDLEGSGEALAP